MKIWLTRHGQTNLNKSRLMQGRTDEPLNENGIRQAREMLAGDVVGKISEGLKGLADLEVKPEN